MTSCPTATTCALTLRTITGPALWQLYGGVCGRQPRRGQDHLCPTTCHRLHHRGNAAGNKAPPFQVIYQTAEDGLGDTVKPRLIEAEADLDRMLVIDKAKRELTLSDERIEKAITQNGTRLIILDLIRRTWAKRPT